MAILHAALLGLFVIYNDFETISCYWATDYELLCAVMTLYALWRNIFFFPQGILEVLHCVLVESPEALNIIKEGHIKSIICLLDKHGRNHKVSKG